MIAANDQAPAERLYWQAIAANSAGHPLAARTLLRRARRRLNELPEPAIHGVALRHRIVLAEGTAESELNGLTAGLEALAEVVDYVERTGDPKADVLLRLHLGYMKVRGGQFVEGVSELDNAVRSVEHADDRSAANIYLNRGTLRLFKGELRGANEDLVRSVAIAERAGHSVEQLKALHNLGYVEFLGGNSAVALRMMDQARSIDADVSKAVIMLDRSRVLIESGLFSDADETLIEAGELFRADKLWKDVGEVELARAECALLDGEFQAARRLAGNARHRFKRRGNDRWRRMAELVLLQGDLEDGRPGLRLAPHALRLATEFEDEGVILQARTARLLAAQCYLRAGDADRAESAAGEADELREDDPISARMHVRLVRAELARATGQPTSTKREIRAGLKELTRYQAQFGGIDLQTASAVHGRKLAELGLALALETGKVARVLAAVEEGRAISSRLASVQAPSDETAAGLLAELRQLSEELRAIETDPAAMPKITAQRKRIREIQRTLRERAWQFEGTGEVRRPAGIAQIGAELEGHGATLVCFFESERQLHAVVWGDRLGKIVALGAAEPVTEQIKRIRADLDVMASGLLNGVMLAAVSASLSRSLASLDDALIRSLGLPDLRLVLVPTGLLATVPWTILPSISGRPVVVAPSATAWLDASTRPGATDGEVFAIAGPDLGRATEEVKTIGRHWRGARVVHGKKATRDELAGGIFQARIVHVAAHGEHQMDNPLFSSIRLADAPLYAWELDQQATAAEHVVLSACELGRATIRPGDEALGLTSVLLRLGTRSVVSGVARVHDHVAADVMTRYHRDLAKGVDSAQALADACAVEKDLPAPFVCFGAAWSR